MVTITTMTTMTMMMKMMTMKLMTDGWKIILLGPIAIATIPILPMTTRTMRTTTIMWIAIIDCVPSYVSRLGVQCVLICTRNMDWDSSTIVVGICTLLCMNEWWRNGMVLIKKLLMIWLGPQNIVVLQHSGLKYPSCLRYEMFFYLMNGQRRMFRLL